MDFIISENQLQLILSEGVKYTDFTSDQLNDIERLGEKAFNKIKSFRDEGTGRDINYWLNRPFPDSFLHFLDNHILHPSLFFY